MALLIPKCPLKKPISFVIQRGISYEANSIKNDYHSSQSYYWEKLVDNRLRTAEARKKFSEMSTTDITKKWEKWDEATIDRFRVQFQLLDINEDGLIDFMELCKVLDEIGDASDTDERRCYFNEVDADHSEGIDFEEFLELMDQVECGNIPPEKVWGKVLVDNVQSGVMGDSNTIGKMCHSTSIETKTVMKIRQFPIQLLLQANLF